LSAARQYSPEQIRFLLVDFNGRNLRDLRSLKHVIRHITDPLELQAELVNLQSEMAVFYDQQRNDPDHQNFPATVIIIDDYDTTSEALITQETLLRQLRDHVRLHSDVGLFIWVAGYLERTGDPFIKQLLLRRSGFAMSQRDSLQRLNIRMTGLPLEAMPEGRAYYPQGNQISVIQTATISDVKGYVEYLNTHSWGDKSPAKWLHPATRDQISQQIDEAQDINGDGGNRWSLEIDTRGLIDDLLSDG